GMELNLYTQKIRTFFAYPSVIEPQETGLAAPAKAFSLELRNASFSYPDSEFSLHNINLKVAAGDRIAIVGENGVGKTTLAKLLLRLYDVDSGEILYNGEPLKEYAIHDLRQRIGVAFQEPQIYALGVRQYLQTYHESEDEVLQDLLTQVGLPLDLDAQLTREFDSRGVMLSGGQGQKLGLVRLLHGEFGLLLLDEPSAALDPLAEDAMVRLIFQQATTTTIMVAHRLSTVRDADCIYLLADGSIAEMGSHDELMALGGRYARMFARQRENYVR
ncbi:MAG: ABC transporter ATP-binding protein/permease, partial [Symbiobacteriaceae bacterium]|nr:ABC transporter ATP-binding protein/permease [Symbiobacteriaceae bacterium]